CLQYSSDPFTF
nr:immunoglobulin light chain junction region [Macaca mulatta]MOX84617.1 immunoglobulin light chain junction region [Macaca mulatta]MOX84933.1 immunoglobulin light chain junction region [Macaca mulatta]MOX85167.1 immunoglobulin light chain junction region [Macaca mulatta]MOX85210.1 immunoglobulin light chain junction region [Macaca mulatta]